MKWDVGYSGIGFRRQVGEAGEKEARSYLEDKGYHWLASNYFTRWGEIDLVMEEKEYLVFVEVRRRRGAAYGEPEESILRSKISHLSRAAGMFLHAMNRWGTRVRFDVVSLGPGGIRHYENAFSPGSEFYC